MAMAGTAMPLAHNTAAAPNATCEADCFIDSLPSNFDCADLGRRCAALFVFENRALPPHTFVCVMPARK
jgi:hypothetical protein